MSRFNVGDKVRLCNGDNAWGWNSEMTNDVGKVATIVKRCYEKIDGYSGYRINISDWTWDERCLMLVENEEEKTTMENETIMTKKSRFKLGKRKENAWVKEATELLNEYNYYPKDEVLRDIFAEWAKQKGWLIDLFKKSEFYNKNGQIVISKDLKRPIDRNGIRKFIEWARDAYQEVIFDKEIMVGLIPYSEYDAIYRNIGRTIDRISTYFNTDNNLIYKGKTLNEWVNERNRMAARITQLGIGGNWSCIYSAKRDRKAYVYDNDYFSIGTFESMLSEILLSYGDDEEPSIIGKKRMEKANVYCEKLNLKARAVEGQKITKFVGKVLKELGLNHDVRIVKETWQDATTGEMRERDKDMGYNYHFALLGDSINPYTYTRDIVISVNPIDFWTMSFGYKWASCHTIDKRNKRGVGHSDYQGCYSGGTMSYQLDNSTFIVYVRPTKEELKSIGEENLPMEVQSKFKRCLFFLGQDKLIQSRVYPDGRDGGDEGLSTQLRNIVQEVIAKLYDTPNMWTLKKGSSECRHMINTMADGHFKDYCEYDDCNVSYLKRINGNRNTNCIEVGAPAICPECGEKHENQEHITCTYCFNHTSRETCECCGTSIDPDYAIEINGHYYCDNECAYNDGYRNTVDDGWHLAEDCYEDDYSEEWYYHEPYDAVETENGHWYSCPENAESDGYSYAELDDVWYYEEDVYCDPNGFTFVMPWHEDEAIETDDGWYVNDDAAREDGWEYVDDEWVRAA